MVVLSPRDELTPAKSPAPSQISLQSGLMAGRLQDVTKLELLNHYLDAGSITLINGSEDAGENSGKAPRPPRPEPPSCHTPHYKSPGGKPMAPNQSRGGPPLPTGKRCAQHRLITREGLKSELTFSLLCKLVLQMTHFSQLAFLPKVPVGESKKAHVS